MNDAVLEMAIQEVQETLYIYVDAKDKHDAMMYVSELHNLTWELACKFGKEELDINITSVATDGHKAWEELTMSPLLDVVYAMSHSFETEKQTRQQLGLLPVMFRSPAAQIQSEYIRESDAYVDEEVGEPAAMDTTIVCGTFDHLHNGHKRLLSFAVSLCRKTLMIAITASPLLLESKPSPELIEPLSIRKANLTDFLKSIRPDLKVEFEDVMEGWGPASIPKSNVNFVVSSRDAKQAKSLMFRTSGYFFIQVVRRTNKSTQSSSRTRAELASRADYTTSN